jgi:hypothetical protein
MLDIPSYMRDDGLMARGKTFSEVLNLRVDPALAAEIARIAKQRDKSESEVARMLLGWGVEAHRAMEAKLLLRRYDEPWPEDPIRMRVTVQWESVDPSTGESEGVVYG